MTERFGIYRQNWLLWVGLLCFFCSGAAALVYQVVWTRMLIQIFGNTTYAIATVLSAFMAGLALGSYVFGRIADKGKNDFLLYGYLEAGVGIYGLMVPWLFHLGVAAYRPLFQVNESYPFVFNLLLFFLSFVLLLLPTVLMGATMPVLSRFFVRSFTDLGRRVGDLYATNTLGAVVGCAAAGYYMIPHWGMRSTVFFAAAVNLIVAAVIFIVDRLREKAPVEIAGESIAATEQPMATSTGSPSWLGWLLLACFGLSGFSALVLENAWTRALTLVIGSSVYSFTTMLVTFLIGLSLGGFLYARLLGRRQAQVSGFGALELMIGLTVLATIPLFEKLPLVFLRLLQALGDSFSLFLTIQLLLSALVMFVPTVLLGMTFPMVARLFTQNLYRVGTGVGTSYAANTLGAIGGAFAGGFILIPSIGVQNTIIVAVLIYLVVGWLLVVADLRVPLTSRAALGVAVLAGVVLIPSGMPRWDPHVLTSGVTIYSDRYADLPLDSLRLEDMRRDEILHYREGLTATISVHRIGRDYLYFKTNGKIDGSHGDSLTQLMSGYLGIFMNPRAERAAVIGLGTGMTTKAISVFPVREIDVMEIEPEMIKAATFFNDKNGKILEDPRVRVIPTDGRNYILATPKRYDLISSEPSNPWIAGIANLYTREFYEVIKSKLTEEGIFAQWFHNYSMSPDDLKMIFRTFGEVFPHATVWGMKESDFLLVGSKMEQTFDYKALQDFYSKSEKLQQDFKDLGLSDMYSILGFYRMGTEQVKAFGESGGINTDDGAQLEYSAPKNVRRATSTLNRRLMEPYLEKSPWLNGNPVPIPESMRYFYVAQAYAASDWNSRALEELDEAIKLDPKNPDFYVLQTKIYLDQDRSAEAAESAFNAMKLSPASVQRILGMSEEFYLREARAVYLKAIELGSREVLPYLGLGNIELHFRDVEEAEKWFDRAAKIAADHPAVLLARGRLLLVKGDAEGARKLLEESREKGEHSATLFGALGEAYSNLEEWQKAAEFYEEALRMRRRNNDWRRSLGIAYAQLGRRRAAEQKFREALALSPDDVESWRELTRLGKKY